MRRRDFIKALAGSVGAWPAAARAQQSAPTRRLGVLVPLPAVVWVPFFDELRRQGFVEGQNLAVDRRGFDAKYDQFSALAGQLVRANPDAILCGGNAAIRALSFAQVESIRQRFERLSPWRKKLKTPFLKLEKENFDANGNPQQLNFYGISAKLYCLFNLEGNKLLVRKPSGHGLGFLQAPYTIAEWQRRTGRKWKEDLPPWIYEAWHSFWHRETGIFGK